MIRSVSIHAAIAALAAGCGGRGWSAAVWDQPVADPAARELVIPFGDGQNGTELVIGVLALARQTEAASISGFEIQVGSCVRAIAPRAQRLHTARSIGHDGAQQHALDRVVVRAIETAFTCKKQVDQVLEPGAGGFSDAKLVTTDDCLHQPIDHVTLRYRYEIDHGFTPPDWAEIERWTGAQLSLGPPRCGGDPATVIRARLHRDGDRPKIATVPRTTSTVRSELIALAQQAEAEAAARRADEATQRAEQALGLLAGDIEAIDDELAYWIAAAHYFAIERDVARFLRRELPPIIGADWATEVGNEIDRIAARYQRVGDVVRLPQAAPWLHAGAMRLAMLHDHVASVLEHADQLRSAESTRRKAAELRATHRNAD